MIARVWDKALTIASRELPGAKEDRFDHGKFSDD
jgi:hypothetical protein